MEEMDEAMKTTEHRVVGRETLNYHTGSEQLTCVCGWWGHANRWNDLDHAAQGGEVPRLPAPTATAAVPRAALHRAIYGDFHCCSRCRAR